MENKKAPIKTLFNKIQERNYFVRDKEIRVLSSAAKICNEPPVIL
jgi:hypothetical protein